MERKRALKVFLAGFVASGAFLLYPAVICAAPAQRAKTHATSTVSLPASSASAPASTAPAPDASEPAVESPDPYESFNRVMFRFNDFFDRVFLKPLATLYIDIVPRPLVTGIRNFFSNVDTVPTIPNDVLQGNFYQGIRDTWRLLINTTVGLLGFFDPASHIGLGPNKEDFGLTLAQWGYRKSGYLVIPFLGPTTTRDLIGFPVDYYFFSIYPYINPARTRYEIYGLGILSRRAELLSYQNVMDQAAIDRYVFVRDAWMQRRTWLINRNKELGDPYIDGDRRAEDQDDDDSRDGPDVELNA